MDIKLRQRMFGSRTVPKVAKYAIVIYLYTQDEDHKYCADYKQAKAKRTAKKMTLKLIERLEQQKKYNFETGNITQSEHLKYVLNDSRKMSYFNVWMLQLNQYVHEIIHKFAPDYDPNIADSKKCDFFKEIFNELNRE